MKFTRSRRQMALFSEDKHWHFIKIVSLGDDSREMPNLVSGKIYHNMPSASSQIQQFKDYYYTVLHTDQYKYNGNLNKLSQT